MNISIITLFPEMFAGPFDASIIKRAKDKNLVRITYVNLRDFGIGRHKVVDDTPYGGGIGMVLRADVLKQAIDAATKSSNIKKDETAKIVLLSAQGTPFTQQKAEQYAKTSHLVLICGHYEGVDERIKNYIDEEVSVGDFVVTGGEIPAMLITDSVVRLKNGVLPQGATQDESFSNTQRLLEYPHYTKPPVFNNIGVPQVLLSGDHKKIQLWRNEKSLQITERIRPDLLKPGICLEKRDIAS